MARKKKKDAQEMQKDIKGKNPTPNAQEAQEHTEVTDEQEQTQQEAAPEGSDAQEVQETTERKKTSHAWAEIWDIKIAIATADRIARRYDLPLEEIYLDMLAETQKSKEPLSDKDKRVFNDAKKKIRSISKKYIGKKDHITTADAENIIREIAAQNPQLSKEAEESVKGLSQTFRPIAEAANTITETLLKPLADIVRSIFSNEYFRELVQDAANIRNYISEHEEELNASIEKAEDFQKDFVPFIQNVIEEEYPGITLDDVLEQFTITGEPENDLAREIIEKAQAKKDSLQVVESVAVLSGIVEDIDTTDAEKLETIKKELPRFVSTVIEKLDYPVDKINKGIWDNLANAPTNEAGQIMFATEKKGSNKEATILYSINFDRLDKLDGIKITKALNAFDKRLYIAAGALYAHGGEYMSAGQIFTAMGGKGKPSASQIQKINDSLTKMEAAHIYLNNSLETPVNKNYPAFSYDASLLPFERVSAYINNTLVDSAIHLFREPPLLTFARERKQITTISRKLLEIPLSQTEDNLQVEDYLIERIADMKLNRKHSRKILFSTVCEKCKIDGKSAKDRQARRRMPDKMNKCLNHFKKQKYIKGYEEHKDGITIEL